MIVERHPLLASRWVPDLFCSCLPPCLPFEQPMSVIQHTTGCDIPAQENTHQREAQASRKPRKARLKHVNNNQNMGDRAYCHFEQGGEL